MIIETQLDAWLMILVGIVLNILVHEIGHYIMAKKRGIYKGFGILPNPHIKLTELAPRFDYFAGLLFSWILVPLWILIFDFSTVWLYFAFTFAGSLGDLFVVVFYKKMKARKERMLKEGPKEMKKTSLKTRIKNLWETFWRGLIIIGLMSGLACAFVGIEVLHLISNSSGSMIVISLEQYHDMFSRNFIISAIIFLILFGIIAYKRWRKENETIQKEKEEKCNIVS